MHKKPLSGILDDLTNFGRSLSGAVQSATDLTNRGTAAIEGAYSAGGVIPIILEDPGLPLLTKEIVRLHEIERRYPSGPTGTPGKGIGLKRLIPLVKAWTFYRENPKLGVVLGLSFILLPFAIGYYAGKK